MSADEDHLDPATGPNSLALLAAIVKAHAVPVGQAGQREPIYCFKTQGGSHLQHPSLKEIPDYDEAVIDELHAGGLVSVEYTGPGSTAITPTPQGRSTVDVYERTQSDDPVADTAPLLAAISAQADAANKLAWPAVRPVLSALRDYWIEGGFSIHGIQMRALLVACPEAHGALFIATIRALTKGGYLEPVSGVRMNNIPAEVALTDRARAVLDGWPGAEPKDLAENLLAVLAERADNESDPVRKRRLVQVGETVKELGMSLTSEVLAKVITGGM
jgi:hypothetical protein